MANISALMATYSSDLDNQKSGVIVQMEGHTLTPPSGQMALKRWRHPVVPHDIHHPSHQ